MYESFLTGNKFNECTDRNDFSYFCEEYCTFFRAINYCLYDIKSILASFRIRVGYIAVSVTAFFLNINLRACICSDLLYNFALFADYFAARAAASSMDRLAAV